MTHSYASLGTSSWSERDRTVLGAQLSPQLDYRLSQHAAERYALLRAASERRKALGRPVRGRRRAWWRSRSAVTKTA
jgi:hypothetical protein